MSGAAGVASPVADLVRAAAARLAAAGVPSPRHDAEELAAHVVGLDRRRLLRLLGTGGLPGWGAPTGAAYDALVARRAEREPLQHLTGRAYFRHLTLAVGPGVFVPRPETEQVAGAVVAEARGMAAPVVVDLATGSGAIALAVATEVPHARVHAVELDPVAHAWAARNVAAHPAASVGLRLGNLADALPDLDGTVDVVVSNPPYIPTGARPLDPEVRDHDPAVALWSGPDGLDAIRAVERTAARLLRPGGLVVVEHADVQGESAPAVLAATGQWTRVADAADLAGRPRFVTARRAAA